MVVFLCVVMVALNSIQTEAITGAWSPPGRKRETSKRVEYLVRHSAVMRVGSSYNSTFLSDVHWVVISLSLCEEQSNKWKYGEQFGSHNLGVRNNLLITPFDENRFC